MFVRPAALAVAVAWALLPLMACRPDGSSAREATSGYRGASVAPPIPKPDFTLTATDGRAFDFRKETEGFVTLLFFGYTKCPDVCPIHLANLGEAMRGLPGEVTGRIKVVFVTTDPERDTLPAIRQWLDAFNPRFVGLRGTIDEVNAILAGIHMPTATRQPLPNGDYGVGHTAAVFAFTRDGLAHMIYPYGVRQQDWVHDLPLLVQEAGTGA